MEGPGLVAMSPANRIQLSMFMTFGISCFARYSGLNKLLLLYKAQSNCNQDPTFDTPV